MTKPESFPTAMQRTHLPLSLVCGPSLLLSSGLDSVENPSGAQGTKWPRPTAVMDTKGLSLVSAPQTTWPLLKLGVERPGGNNCFCGNDGFDSKLTFR